MVKVKNLHGTATRTPNGYSSWKDYWAAQKGYWPSTCAAYGCNGKAEVGAHVKKVNSYDNKWYIVPACKEHNNDRDCEYFVDESMLVPVN